MESRETYASNDIQNLMIELEEVPGISLRNFAIFCNFWQFSGPKYGHFWPEIRDFFKVPEFSLTHLSPIEGILKIRHL